MEPEELAKCIDTGDLSEAENFFAENNKTLSKLKISFVDKIEFHTDDGLPWTQVERTYSITFNKIAVYSWWEEYCGYYGCGGTGWWVENSDADGPKAEVKTFLEKLGLEIPSIDVPKPKT